MKLTGHAWFLMFIALIVVLVFAYLIPCGGAAYWIGLGCTAAMFILCGLSLALAFRRDEKAESKLLGWPIFKVGYVALAVQIVIGFALMLLSRPCPVWAAAIIEVIVFAVTLICMTVKDATREAVTATESRTADQTAAWKAIRAKAAAIAAGAGTPAMKKLAEEIRFADPMPTELDERISAMLDMLSGYATDENIGKVMTLMQQRKALAKSGK